MEDVGESVYTCTLQNPQQQQQEEEGIEDMECLPRVSASLRHHGTHTVTVTNPFGQSETSFNVMICCEYQSLVHHHSYFNNTPVQI